MITLKTPAGHVLRVCAVIQPHEGITAVAECRQCGAAAAVRCPNKDPEQGHVMSHVRSLVLDVDQIVCTPGKQQIDQEFTVDAGPADGVDPTASSPVMSEDAI